MSFPPRQAQTRIKHELLAGYAGAWGGIISQGVRGAAGRSHRQMRLDLVYLDGFAGYGRYERDADQPEESPAVWGSPVIGIRALEKIARERTTDLLDIRVTAILVEQDRQAYAELVENLGTADFGSPIQEADAFTSAGFGRVTVINDDFRDQLAGLLSELDEQHFLLAFVDPSGPCMPFEALSRLIGRERTDSIVFFPAHDVELRGASALKPYGERTATERQNIARNDRHFGTRDWRSIAKRVAGRELPERVEAYAEHYEQRLKSVDDDLKVKSIGLRFSTIDRPCYHLFLTTRDVNGAYRMNDVLRSAEARKHWTRWADREQRAQASRERDGVLELDLDVPMVRPPGEVEKPTNLEVAEAVRGVLSAGETVTYQRLLGRLVDTPYTRTEIGRAMRSLSRTGVCAYQGGLVPEARIKVMDGGVPA